MIEYDEAAIRKEPEKKTGSSHFTGNVQRKKFDNCWIHEEDGGEHPIWKCRMFQAKSLQEKMDLVLKNKACQACLEIECEGAKKPEDCKKRFRCPIEGCNEPHNALLHA